MRWALELVSKINLQGDERLLDIGCGDGKVTARIAESLSRGSVTGIDSSPEMIDYAKKSFPETEYPNISFQVMDAADLKFSGEFDYVFSNATLHWVKDQHAVMKGVAKSLKTGGKLFIQMGAKGNASAMFEVMNELIRRDKWKPFFENTNTLYNFFLPDEYRVFIKNAGLSPIRIEVVPKEMVHQGTDGIKNWLRSVWLPYTQRVPDNEREEFINLLTENFEKENPPDINGIFHIDMLRLEVEAEKISDY